MYVSEAERISRQAIKSLYEGRPLAPEQKTALRALIQENACDSPWTREKLRELSRENENLRVENEELKAAISLIRRSPRLFGY